MPRYIDADLICYSHNCNGCAGDSCEYCEDYIATKEEIDHIPTATIQMLHAKWIKASGKANIGMKCSNCNARIKYSEYFNGNHLYCHKCGSRMDL